MFRCIFFPILFSAALHPTQLSPPPNPRTQRAATCSTWTARATYFAQRSHHRRRLCIRRRRLRQPPRPPRRCRRCPPSQPSSAAWQRRPRRHARAGQERRCHCGRAVPHAVMAVMTSPWSRSCTLRGALRIANKQTALNGIWVETHSIAHPHTCHIRPLWHHR